MTASPLALLLAALSVAAAPRDVAVSTADELRVALRQARPGTRILVAPGDYRGYIGAKGLRGAPGKPIVVAAAEPERPPVLHGGKECLHLSSVSHLVLRNLVLVRGGVNCLNVDDGGSPDTPSHHVVLDGLTVHMVGCRRGIITGCTFRHRDGQGATGVQAKGGTRDLLVYRCRFHDAGRRAINLGGCTDKYTRPPDATYQARRVVAVGNTFVGSDAPVAFVGSDACGAAFNTIYRPRSWVLRILQESRQPRFVPCRNGEFRGNLVVWRWRELKAAADVRDATQPETFRFAGNWWFCEDRPSRSRPDLPVPDRDGVVGRDPGLVADGLDIRAEAAPGHGAHAARAAELFRQLGPKLAPWAHRTLLHLEHPAAR